MYFVIKHMRSIIINLSTRTDHPLLSGSIWRKTFSGHSELNTGIGLTKNKGSFSLIELKIRK